MDYILLLVGFFLLIKGADIFVEGASSISKKLGIPAIIIGLTIVSLGTSAPELAVSIISAIEGSNEIAVGNVIGSNVFNTLVVLGATVTILPLIIEKAKVKKDFLISTIILFIFILLAFDGLVLNGGTYISRFDGIILLTLAVIYILFLIKTAKKHTIENNNVELEEVALEVEEIVEIKTSASIIKIFIGAIGIVIGGQFVVDSASAIAQTFNLSDKLVGLTIVAIGTSLPELVTSVVAALKGEEDMAIGNILGSNIFNVLLIIGTSATISPILVSPTLIVDFSFLTIITIILGLLILASKKETKKLGKIEGIIFICTYIGYMAYIVSRN